MVRREALTAFLLLSLLFGAAHSQTTVPTCDAIASATAVPLPWYSAPFNTDPRAACGGSDVCSYGWRASDPADTGTPWANIQTNMVTLAGGSATSNGQYINVTAATGANSVGAVLPGNLFGPSNGDLTKGTAGWSFEFTFKPSAAATWGKIMDIGNPNSGGCRDDIVYSWTESNPRTEFAMCNGAGAEAKLVSYTPIAVGTWYHALVVVQQVGNMDGSAQTSTLTNNYQSLWYLYINGQSYGTIINNDYLPQARPAPYPGNVFRRNGNLGKSNWPDAFWAGSLRHFNVWNSALTATQVDALFRNRMGGCTLTPGTTATAALIGVPSYATGATPIAVWQLPVNTRPSNADDVHYGWMAQDAADVSCDLNAAHQGLIVLGGSYDEGLGAGAGGPYINLYSTSGANSIPQDTALSSLSIGGASTGSMTDGTYGWTFEIIMKPRLIETWAKLFDIANPQVGGRCRDNILAGWYGNGPGWTFQTCDSNGVEYNEGVASLNGAVDQWMHAMFVMQRNPNGNATYFIYQNGQLTFANPTQYYPPAVTRTNAFLGRSSWAADFFWDGYIDYFNIYDRAFSAPQVTSRYTAAMGSNVGTNKFYCPVPNNPRADLTYVQSLLLFSATFDEDPRAAAGGTEVANYQWLATDSLDSSTDRALHTGLILLNNGSINTQFINLTQATGPNSIGKTLNTARIGGRETTGNIFNSTAGITFEVTWKAQGQITWAKIFDIGAVRRSTASCNYDIFFGWHASDTNDLDFQICNYFGEVFGPAPFTTTLGTLNSWHHFVASVRLTPDGRSNYVLYFDGAAVYNASNLYYPTAMPRPYALLGDSNWADSNWQGYIDTFNVYQQALTPAQVATIYNRAMIPTTLPQCDAGASATTVPRPWYSLNVTTDPRGAAGGPSVAAYGWTYTDSNDSPAVQAVHYGLINLGGGTAGSASQYINLSTTSGAYSIGYTFDGNIGGSGAIDAFARTGTAGWTFEAVFKATAQRVWGKVFDFGNAQDGGRCREDILLGLSGSSLNLQFDYCDSRGNEYMITSLQPILLNQWYHVTAVMQQLRDTDNNGIDAATYTLYINSVLAGSTSGPLPSAVRRVNAQLGKSSWNDEYFQGYLDTLNIYNYALNTAQIAAIYLNKMGSGCSINYPTGPSVPGQWGSRALPFVASSVSPQPPSAFWSLPTSTKPERADDPATTFGWIPYDPADQPCGIDNYHKGLIALGGSSNPGVEGPYLNLTASSGNRYVGGSPLPLQIGGPGSGSVTLGTRGWSFEFIVKTQVVEKWAKFFDISNPQGPAINGICRDNIYVGWEVYGPEWTFGVCDETGREYILGNAFGNVNVTDWLYATVVIQQNDDGSANYYSYNNGRLFSGRTASYYPPLKNRVNGFLGRSSWVADSYWDGYIDYFNIYDVALSPAQVRALYNRNSDDGRAAVTCTSSTPVTPVIDPSALVLDLTFSSDPRSGATNYNWVATDNNDTSSIQGIHSGLLYLAGGSSQQYVNLSATSGPNYVGRTMDPWMVGDQGRGDENLDTAGWTWEIVFKPTASQQWGKLFDFGGERPTGVCRFDILFGQFNQNPRSYSFSSCDQQGAEFGLRPAMTSITPYQWHHTVLVIELGPNGQGIYRTYLNGARQPLMEGSGWFPTKQPRVHALLGRSNWQADAFWAGYIDTFRIYSVAATDTQADTMYRRMLDPNYVPSDNSSSSSSLSGGAIAGIVIGAIAGAIILLAVLAVMCCGFGSGKGKKGSSSDAEGEYNRGSSHKFDEIESSRNVEMSHVQGETHEEENA